MKFQLLTSLQEIHIYLLMKGTYVSLMYSKYDYMCILYSVCTQAKN